MKIFAIDTTTKYISIGIADGPKVYEYRVELGRKASSLLTVHIKRVLDTLGWKVIDIDYFGCWLGPGSFTGTRIGVAAVKGLAWILQKPVIGICSLDSITENVKFALHTQEANVICVLDAKRDLVYSAGYRYRAGVFKKISRYLLVRPQELVKKIKPGSIIIGDGLTLHKELFMRQVKGVYFLDKDFWYPTGRALVRLCQERIASGKTTDAFKVRPIYLYPKECQIKKQR